jgi:methylenetetrahydrofolate reductase (NADPH)
VSRLRELVDGGGEELILTGEAPTVDGGDLGALGERVAEIASWADAVNATDNPAAHAHASNVAVAIALIRLGIEPVLQVVARDKNRIACQSDIVGAALHGVENVCCLTGDDVTAGDEPEARRVFDLDGPQLVRVATGLAEGHYLSGRPLDPAPRLFVGAVENPAAPPLRHRAQRAAKKIAAGARFLQLQICYHPDRLESLVRELHGNGLAEQAALLPTIVLVRGASALSFMHRAVPGIDVPAGTIARVAQAADAGEEAYQLALEQAEHALSLPGVRGLHITDFRHDGAVARLCRDLGIPTKEERRANAHRAQLPV